ncbi:hypothetical protein RSOLAG22IIIB_02886 [Rhizoctonia solani]|uniref:Uncharacterized protein n=1 Tax=Rhizoctonia solani TaxID=456999 RepID=A0A0K6FL67_9AGAM|nr:hypothetical protein RSOLAG22IIIB_02886 [Rhizoctonia solani]
MSNPSLYLRENIEVMDDDNWNRRNLIGSMAEWLAGDSTGERRHSQVPTWSEVVALTFILEPIVKRGTAAPNDQTRAREESPWHLINVVLEILARQELTRRQVVQEAKRALGLNLHWQEEKTRGVENAKEIALLPKQVTDKLKYLASSNVSTFMRERYRLVSSVLRQMHIYETLRTRAAGVDELIKSYFPREIPKDPDYLYLNIMKSATQEEMRSYLGERKLVYTLYRDVDTWEDQLQKEGVTEEMMNSPSPNPEREFSYPVEFERKFPPPTPVDMDWIKVIEITLGWSRSVSNMVNTLEDIFRPDDPS